MSECPSCSSMTRRASSLQDQINAARKAVAEWPEWMRETAYFASPMISTATTYMNRRASTMSDKAPTSKATKP